MKPPTVTTAVAYVGPDGRLTPAGFKLLEDMLRLLADHEARLVVLEP